MKKVLVLGATGFLGGYVTRALAGLADVHVPWRAGNAGRIHGAAREVPPMAGRAFDAREPSTLEPLLLEVEPQAIVNCVARKRLDLSPAAAAEGAYVNGAFPHYLADAASRCAAHVIQISTDAVFSGGAGPYEEGDIPDPSDLYGASKLTGELSGPGCVTLRTSFVGLTDDGAGLVSWFLGQTAVPGARVSGYGGYLSTGVYAGTLAAYIAKLCLLDDPPEGIFHAGGESWNKFWLLSSLRERLGLDCTVVREEWPVIDRSLVSSRFFAEIDERKPTAESLLEDLTIEIERRSRARSLER